MAKTVELHDRITNELQYPITHADNVVGLEDKIQSAGGTVSHAFTKQHFKYFNNSNPNIGYLVALNINTESNTMCTVNIKGITYDIQDSQLPKDSILHFYLYHDPNKNDKLFVLAESLLHLGYDFGNITILDIDGWAHLFFKDYSIYSSVLVQAFATYSTSATTGIDLVRSIGFSEIPANATVLKEVKPSIKPLADKSVTIGTLSQELQDKVNDEYAYTKIHNSGGGSIDTVETHGFLISLNSTIEKQDQIVVHIIGHTHSNNIPINTIAQLYTKTSVSPQVSSLLHLGYDFGSVKFILHEGVCKLWISATKEWEGIVAQAFVVGGGGGKDIVTKSIYTTYPEDAELIVDIAPSNKPLPNNFVTENNLTEELRGKINVDITSELNKRVFFVHMDAYIDAADGKTYVNSASDNTELINYLIKDPNNFRYNKPIISLYNTLGRGCDTVVQITDWDINTDDPYIRCITQSPNNIYNEIIYIYKDRVEVISEELKIPIASEASYGLMSDADKRKLNSIKVESTEDLKIYKVSYNGFTDSDGDVYLHGFEIIEPENGGDHITLDRIYWSTKREDIDKLIIYCYGSIKLSRNSKINDASSGLYTDTITLNGERFVLDSSQDFRGYINLKNGATIYVDNNRKKSIFTTIKPFEDPADLLNSLPKTIVTGIEDLTTGNSLEFTVSDYNDSEKKYVPRDDAGEAYIVGLISKDDKNKLKNVHNTVLCLNYNGIDYQGVGGENTLVSSLKPTYNQVVEALQEAKSKGLGNITVVFTDVLSMNNVYITLSSLIVSDVHNIILGGCFVGEDGKLYKAMINIKLDDLTSDVDSRLVLELIG